MSVRLRVAIITFVLAIVVRLLLYTVRVAPRRVEVVRLRVGLPELPPEWNGVRIAHLTDFHAGGRGVSLEMLRHARTVAEGFRPDVLALTGDFYHGGRRVDAGGLFTGWPQDVLVVAVLGNHDDRGGDEHVRALVGELRTAGVHVLRKESIAVTLRGRKAWVVGVDDPHAWKMDDDRAFRAVPDAEDALLYLAHSPAAASTMPVGRARLLLSGHTHGGQIRILPSGRIPFVAWIRRMTGAPARNDPPFFRGVHWFRGAVVVISNGLGVSQAPVRFLANRQVVLIELARADAYGPPCDDVARYVTRL